MSNTPVFDKKYREIIKCPEDTYYKSMYWIDKHSVKSVSVKKVQYKNHADIYLAFEDPADALIFKIKFK